MAKLDVEHWDLEQDGGWLVVHRDDRPATAYIIPCCDEIRHEVSSDCVCGPHVDPVKCDDGSIGYVVSHHSLDGREIDEASRGEH